MHIVNLTSAVDKLQTCTFIDYVGCLEAFDEFNPLRFQRTAGGTPSGERVKLSDTQKKVIKKKKR